MRLRDAFLVLVAAVAVVAAAVVVAAVSAGNRDWDLLVPLLALSLAGSIVTILTTLFVTLTEAGVPAAPPEPAMAPEAPAADPELAAPAVDEAAGDSEGPAPDAPAPVRRAPTVGLFDRVPHWAVIALDAVFLLVIPIAAVVVARVLVVQYSDLRPTKDTLDLFAATAWGVLVLGLAALYLATPSSGEHGRRGRSGSAPGSGDRRGGSRRGRRERRDGRLRTDSRHGRRRVPPRRRHGARRHRGRGGDADRPADPSNEPNAGRWAAGDGDSRCRRWGRAASASLTHRLRPAGPPSRAHLGACAAHRASGRAGSCRSGSPGRSRSYRSCPASSRSRP